MPEMIGSISLVSDIPASHKEWDETSCPICMDHPHNAVLLICNSHEKGCRSYICDTSYRHSNCLDRFRKPKMNNCQSSDQPGSLFYTNPIVSNSGQGASYSHVSESPQRRTNLIGTNEDNLEENVNATASRSIEVLEENNSIQEPDAPIQLQGEEIHAVVESDGSDSSKTNDLKCPLCRGNVKGWTIVKEARQYFNQKLRTCSRESCSFLGNYKELRRHARRSHPSSRPSEIDPSRQRAWRRMERQREYGDILSAIRSTMPGAIVLGDYVIDNADGPSRHRENSQSGNGPLWPTFFLFHMIRNPLGSLGEPRGSSRTWRTHRGRVHRSLWGENLLGTQDEDGASEEDISVPRRRRRFMRSRPEEEHQ